jgi:hypothetical protein
LVPLASHSKLRITNPLINDLALLERDIACPRDATSASQVPTLTWPDIAEQVWIPKWRWVAEKASDALPEFQLRHVYPALTDPSHFFACASLHSGG